MRALFLPKGTLEAFFVKIDSAPCSENQVRFLAWTFKNENSQKSSHLSNSLSILSSLMMYLILIYGFPGARKSKISKATVRAEDIGIYVSLQMPWSSVPTQHLPPLHDLWWPSGPRTGLSGPAASLARCHLMGAKEGGTCSILSRWGRTKPFTYFMGSSSSYMAANTVLNSTCTYPLKKNQNPNFWLPATFERTEGKKSVGILCLSFLPPPCFLQHAPYFYRKA